MLPVEGWRIGDQDDSGIFNIRPMIGFVVVRHAHGDGTFNVEVYPLTSKGVREDDDYLVMRPDGKVEMPGGASFASIDELNTFRRLHKAAE